ncbi:MAG: hypothetical protein AB1720_11970, partial [Pseudomonadota bacterium]
MESKLKNVARNYKRMCRSINQKTPTLAGCSRSKNNMPLNRSQFPLPNALRSTNKELNHESDGNQPAGLAETVWDGS